MADSERLIETLKRLLRSRGLTYADVSRHLGLSEASVKRLFSQGSFSLQRMDRVCGLLGIDLSDLVAATDQARARIRRLTPEQERELVSDHRLLLVAICARHHWTFDDIVEQYAIESLECTRLLGRLDRLKLIELLPGNRIKPMVAHDFEWIQGGPIESFFSRQVQHEFLQGAFDQPGQQRLYMTAMLSRASVDRIGRKLRDIAADVAALQRADARLPRRERQEVSLLMAMRDWELSVFRALRRNG